ncbi:MAG: hypothetical protein RJA44_2587 [Pseudomonadota bacterium]
MKHSQYNPALDNPPLSDAEFDELERTLDMLQHAESMDLECLDGYLTALLLAPQLPDSDIWVPLIWGGYEAPFSSGKQTKHFVQLVLRHMAAIDRQLKTDVEALEPIFSFTEVAGQELVDAELWCIGFLQATTLLPELWDAKFDDPELGDALAPIVLLGADPEQLTPQQQGLLSTPQGRDGLSRQVPDAIVELYQARA